MLHRLVKKPHSLGLFLCTSDALLPFFTLDEEVNDGGQAASTEQRTGPWMALQAKNKTTNDGGHRDNECHPLATCGLAEITGQPVVIELYLAFHRDSRKGEKFHASACNSLLVLGELLFVRCRTFVAMRLNYYPLNRRRLKQIRVTHQLCRDHLLNPFFRKA